MHLKCPTCGAAIPAGQINIQELIAVCPDCDHVFVFNRDSVARKVKPCKLKMPERVQLRADEHQLNLSYKRVFGPGPKFGLVMVTIGMIAYAGMGLGAAHDGAPRPVVMIFAALALLMVYVFVVFMTTTTRITADEDGVIVKSGPLPFPIKDDKTLSTALISHVAFEKTQETFPPGMPTHNVYAELHGGERVNVVTSLPREHARYLAATLDDYLRAAESADNMIENEFDDDDELFAESATGSDGEIDPAILQEAQHMQHREAG